MNNIHTLMIAAALIAAAPLQAGTFLEAPAEAKTKAQAAKADFIVMAYGGDWDRLGKSYLARCWKPSVKLISASTYLSIAVYPQNPDKKLQEQIDRQQKGVNINVSSLPSVHLFDASGFCYATLSGDQLPRTPQALADAIANLQSLRQKRDALIGQSASKQGVEKAKLLGRAAEIPGIARNQSIIKDIEKCDSTDKSGYVKRLTFSIWPLHDCLKKPKDEALAQLDKELQTPSLTAEQKQKIYALRGTVLRRNKATAEELKQNYDKMRALAPHSMLGKAAVNAARVYAK